MELGLGLEKGLAGRSSFMCTNVWKLTRAKVRVRVRIKVFPSWALTYGNASMRRMRQRSSADRSRRP